MFSSIGSFIEPLSVCQFSLFCEVKLCERLYIFRASDQCDTFFNLTNSVKYCDESNFIFIKKISARCFMWFAYLVSVLCCDFKKIINYKFNCLWNALVSVKKKACANYQHHVMPHSIGKFVSSINQPINSKRNEINHCVIVSVKVNSK